MSARGPGAACVVASLRARRPPHLQGHNPVRRPPSKCRRAPPPAPAALTLAGMKGRMCSAPATGPTAAPHSGARAASRQGRACVGGARAALVSSCLGRSRPTAWVMTGGGGSCAPLASLCPSTHRTSPAHMHNHTLTHTQSRTQTHSRTHPPTRRNPGARRCSSRDCWSPYNSRYVLRRAARPKSDWLASMWFWFLARALVVAAPRTLGSPAPSPPHAISPTPQNATHRSMASGTTWHHWRSWQ